MAKSKKESGRPAKGYPPRIDATAEEIPQVFMRTKQSGPKVDFEKVYRCVECERVVEWPEKLYRDGRCEECREVRTDID